MKTAHNVKLLNGSKQEVSYTGVETVTMPGTDGQDKVFTAGAPIDAMDISPDFSGGDMPLEAPEGYVVRSATIKKPEGAEQVIAKGETLAGISGAYVTPGTAREITPDFSGGDQTVAAEGDERWTEVTVKKPEGLVAENITKGVEIAGVSGAYVTPGTAKEITPDFGDYLVVDNQEDVSVLLSDRVNIGKYVKYTGETGDYISGRIYKVVDEYEAFDPNSCPATAVEVTSDTSLTATLGGCDVGDLVVAAFAIRSDLVSLSDGWTLISTSQSTTEINPSNSFNQTLSFAYKYATSTTEELTVTQTTAARLYINMVSLSGVSGFADAGYQYQDNTNVSDSSFPNFARPAGMVVIWGATKSIWVANSPYHVWELSNDSRLIQIGSATQSRLLLAIDKSEDVDVTFYSGKTYSNDAYICGALSVELEPAVHLIEADHFEIPTTDTQTVTAEGDERWSSVTVKKPEGLVPGNIANGVEIAGVTGTLKIPKIVFKEIPGTNETTGIKTLITAEELETIGFANANQKFVFLLDGTYIQPNVSSWNVLSYNYIRYPGFMHSGQGYYYGIYSYRNKNGNYSNYPGTQVISSSPWDEKTVQNTVYYEGGEIKYNLASSTHLGVRNDILASQYYFYVIAGAF